MYAEANDLRERAKARNAYVYRFLTNDKDHHDEVLRFLTHDEQGPKCLQTAIQHGIQTVGVWCLRESGVAPCRVVRGVECVRDVRTGHGTGCDGD